MTRACTLNSLIPKTSCAGGQAAELTSRTSSPSGSRSRSGARRLTAKGLEHDDKLPHIGVSRQSQSRSPAPDAPKRALLAAAASCVSPTLPSALGQESGGTSLTNVVSGAPSVPPTPIASHEIDMWNSAHWRHQSGNSKQSTTPKCALSPRSSISSGSARHHSPRGTGGSMSRQIHDDISRRQSRLSSRGNTSTCGEEAVSRSSSSHFWRQISASSSADNKSVPPAEGSEDESRFSSEDLDVKFDKLFSDPNELVRAVTGPGDLFELPGVDCSMDMKYAGQDQMFVRHIRSQDSTATADPPSERRADRVLKRLSMMDFTPCDTIKGKSEGESFDDEKKVETMASLTATTVGTETRTKLSKLQQTFSKVQTQIAALANFTTSTSDQVGGLPALLDGDPKPDESFAALAPSSTAEASVPVQPAAGRSATLDDVRKRIRALRVDSVSTQAR
eukprot:gnl/TRDRNA2_/TRDRNA2_200239_c0_seq1.p1 gnl/TRDRNA2_/TRDRNA2_200239_c0~~gnl/TRDRNA2_/TRDRNA2_200239_c0_seq1.p1  ORF type:complete len:448 (+),score=46.31 gnl/TRDRNA2_/TRDRNA2_200239_c0_seq1:90-1433(+)